MFDGMPVTPSGPALLCVRSCSISFSFGTCAWSVRIVYFLWFSWKTVLFQEVVRFFQVLHSVGTHLPVVVSYDLFLISVESIVTFFISNVTDLSRLLFVSR